MKLNWLLGEEKELRRVIKLNYGIFTDPLFYITIALFSGELSLKRLGIPIDVKASVMYLLTFIAIVLLATRKELFIKKSLLVFVLYFYLIARNIISQEYVLLNYEFPMIGTLILLFFLNCTTNDHKRIQDFLDYSFLITGSLIVMGLAYHVLSRSSGRLYFVGGPNGFYKIALIFGCISFYKIATTKRIVYALTMVLSIFAVFMTGSKGGILSLLLITLFSYVMFLYCNKKNGRRIVVAILVLVAALLVAFILANYLIQHSEQFRNNLERALSIFTGQRSELSSVVARKDLIKLAFQDFLQAPFLGKGALVLHYETMGTANFQDYAHNIFMEMLGEQGCVGFIICLAVLIHTTATFIRSHKSSLTCCLFACFLTYLIGAQFSGNMLDSKMLFGFSILMDNWSYNNYYVMNAFECEYRSSWSC